MSIATTLIVAACFVCLAVASNKQEVCQWQTFRASCAADEVIVMKEARYGRMKVGKCIPRDYMVGCSADVTDYMHGRCSGQQHCRVPIPDHVMFAAQPCAKDLVAYLEADYECVKVAKWNKESCDQVMTANSGLIAKPADSVEDIRKKHHCPRRIVAQPGQTINVYLSDFFDKYHQEDAPAVPSATASPVPECIPYGHIAEDGTTAPAGICGGEMAKDQLVYTSRSNVIDITLTAPSSHSHHYLIKYEVVGCPTLNAPQNGWIDMQQDRAIIHCNNSHTASELVCKDNHWVGQMNNCSAHGSPVKMSMSGMPLSSLFTNTGILVGVSVGVAMGVLIGVALLALAVKMFSTKKAEPVLPTLESDKPQNVDYQYLPVVDPIYVPVATEDGTKTYVPTNPVHHIVNSLYDAPRGMADMASLRTYAPALQTRFPALRHADGSMPIYTV